MEVRQAARRESDRVREHLQADGCTDVVRDAAQLMTSVYRPLSDSSHGRRAAVRAYISESLRQAATGAHPSAQERLVSVEGGLLLVEDLVQVVGDALAFLYGELSSRIKCCLCKRRSTLRWKRFGLSVRSSNVGAHEHTTLLGVTRIARESARGGCSA